jgi:hypothetical protein
MKFSLRHGSPSKKSQRPIERTGTPKSRHGADMGRMLVAANTSKYVLSQATRTTLFVRAAIRIAKHSAFQKIGRVIYVFGPPAARRLLTDLHGRFTGRNCTNTR